MKKMYILLSSIVLLNVIPLVAVSQNLSSTDYIKATWMTTRMYGGQRSGDGPNWLVYNHTPTASSVATLASKGIDASQIQAGKAFTKDADGAHNLSGGWFDCGDHVKFGQTEFYSAYVLLKGYEAFPEGYYDFYSANYVGYANSGDWSFEGGKGTPNRIPDILDEVKYATDYFIKCAPNATTFYSQVGDGDADHKNWVTSVAMSALSRSEGGQKEGSRSIVKNPNDASMPSFCAATLALMSRMYKPFDPVYANTCLTHAKYAYQYAKSKRGNTVSAGQFYPANVKWEDDYASACAELYWATGDEAYKTEALSYAGDLKNHNWAFNYNNNDDIAAYNLAKLGSTSAETLFNTFASYYKSTTSSNGLFSGGDASWGPLRYNANVAFIVALHGAYTNATTVDKFVYDQINYILGVNSSNHSFVVGFNRANCSNCKSSVKPHHRNVFMQDDIMANKENIPIPAKNAQFGFLLGGTRNPGTVSDLVENYYQNEGGIDYNAGLVGALAYIVSRVAPIDPNQFGHPTPDLGKDQSFCGLSSLLLDSKIPTDGKTTFTWKKDGTTVVPASTSANTYTATSAGTYTCVVDSAGKWTTEDKITLTASLPNVNLGSDINLCSPAWDTIKSGIVGNGILYEWKRNNAIIADASAASLIVYDAGTYSLTISASGCASKSGNVEVTSALPNVKHDTLCAPGTANLQILSSGNYQWYDVATGGTVLATGTTYSPTVNASKTYYVQDASSVNGSVGAKTLTSTSLTNWGVSENLQLAFNVSSSFTVNSIKIAISQIYNTAQGTVTVEILKGDGTAFSPAKKFTSNSIQVSSADNGKLKEFTFSDFNVDKSWGESLRIRVSAVSFSGALGFNESGASYPYNSTPSGVMTITGAHSSGESKSNWYLYFYDWKISAGSTCDRTPVRAIIDAQGNCDDTQAPTIPGAITISNSTLNSFTATWEASTDNVGVSLYDVLLNGTLHQSVATNSITITDLACNSNYTIQVRASDAAGNYSDYNAEKATATLSLAEPKITNSSANICEGEAILLSVEPISGATYVWTGPSSYTASGQSVSISDASVLHTGTYSVTITAQSCQSDAASIEVVVNATPEAPQVISVVTYSKGESTQPLSAIGSNLQWYESANSTVALSQAPTPASTEVGSTSYFVSQTIANCESPRAEIVVTIVETASTQTIALQEGWNILSLFVEPTNTSVEYIFADILSQVEIIKNDDGFFQPNQAAYLQSITTLELGKGYVVKMSAAATLTVTGQEAPATPIQVAQGWNLIGYPVNAQQPTLDALGTVWQQVQVIKNFDSYLDKDSGLLQTLTPGEGYYIYMNQAATISF